MKKAKINFTSLVIVLLLFSSFSYSQKRKLNNQVNYYYEQSDYYNVCKTFENKYSKDIEKIDNAFLVKVANSYYFLNKFDEAYKYYNASEELNETEKLNYVDVLISENEKETAAMLLASINNKESERYKAYHKSVSVNNENYLNNCFISKVPLSLYGQSFGVQFYKEGIIFSSVKDEKDTMDCRGYQYLDMFYSKKTGNKFSTPVYVDKILNSPLHDGCPSLTADELKMYFSRSTDDGTLKILETSKIGDRWGNPKSLPFNRPDYSCTHPSISSDGNTLIFTSNMLLGKGEKDLYVSYRKNGEWSIPKNLGNEINSFGDDCFPFLDKNGVLYFASSGREGYGGLDIYRAVPNEDGWDTPELLPMPVNSTYDDFNFIIKETEGYFASNRDTRTNDDQLYFFIINKGKSANILKGITVDDNENQLRGVSIDLIDEDGNVVVSGKTNINGLFETTFPCGNYKSLSIRYQKQGYQPIITPIEFDPVKTKCKDVFTAGKSEVIEFNGKLRKIRAGKAQFKGVVTDCVSNKLIAGAGVKIVDKNGEIVGSGFTRNDGSYDIIFEKPWEKSRFNELKIVVEKSEFKEFNKNVAYDDMVDATSTNENPKLLFNPCLKWSLESDVEISVQNIYFDSNSAVIKEESFKTIDEIVTLLKVHTGKIIEIGAHSDSRGGDSYNKKLSERRAEAIKNYLVNRGVSYSALIAKGYGEEQLINRCSNGIECSEEEHQQNRRVVFKVSQK